MSNDEANGNEPKPKDPKPRDQKQPDVHTKQESADVEVLGQRLNLPNSLYKYRSFVVLVLCVTLLGGLLVWRGYSLSTKDGFALQTVVSVSGDVSQDKVSLNNFVTMGFWTPSDKTEMFIKDTTAQTLFWQRNSWQKCIGPYKTTLDSLNIKFGDSVVMKMRGILGYRRYEVFGHGRNRFKAGWWWQVGIKNNMDDAALKDFRGSYTKFWNPSAKGTDEDKVYIELFGNSGKYLQKTELQN